MDSQQPALPRRKWWKPSPIAIRIAVIVLLIIIVGALVIFFKLRRDNSSNVADLFGERFDIKELPQVSDVYGLRDFKCYNPCLFTLQDGNLAPDEVYWVYRMCNFTLCPGNRNAFHDQRTQSRTLITNPSGDLFAISHPNVSGAVCAQGCQDARTFICDNKLYLACNDTSGENCRREMYIMEVDINRVRSRSGPVRDDNSKKRDVKPRDVSVVSMERLNAEFGNERDQKNWMPLVIDNQIYFVYSVNPHIILRYRPGLHPRKYPGKTRIPGEKEIVNCEKVAETSNSKLPSGLRGGGQIIRVRKWNRTHALTFRQRSDVSYRPEDLYLGIVHTRDSLSEYSTYFYAFEIVHPYRVKYISKGFVFGEAGSHSKRIQFASGLAQVVHRNHETGRDENMLYITYGENDCTAKLCILNEAHVLSALVRV
jgi:hypothetical protein